MKEVLVVCQFGIDDSHSLRHCKNGIGQYAKGPLEQKGDNSTICEFQ
jgi:hypothetical protein